MGAFARDRVAMLERDNADAVFSKIIDMLLPLLWGQEETHVSCC